MGEILMCCGTTYVCSIKRANLKLTAVKLKFPALFYFRLDVVNDARMWTKTLGLQSWYTGIMIESEQK